MTFSLSAAFLKYYAAIPAAVLIIANTVIALAIAKQNKKNDDGNAALFVTVAAGLCTPFVISPLFVSHHRYLRRSLLSTNILILVGLIFLLCFPLIIPSDNLADILPHIDMTSTFIFLLLNFTFIQ